MKDSQCVALLAAILALMDATGDPHGGPSDVGSEYVDDPTTHYVRRAKRILRTARIETGEASA